MNEYGFDEQLAMSAGVIAEASVGSVVREHIPGAGEVRRANVASDKKGVDYWVEMPGRRLSIDAKVRKEDWWATHPEEDDLALETWSVKGYRLPDGTDTQEPMVVGWTRDPTKSTDYVLWIWTGTGRFCLIPFPFLCRVFQDHWEMWRMIHRVSRQFTPNAVNGRLGWYSECVFVPRRDVWAEIYRRYAPNLKGRKES